MPDIFSDAASRIAAYRRIRNTWTVFGLLCLLAMSGSALLSIQRLLEGPKAVIPHGFDYFLLAMWALVFFVYALIFIKLTLKMRKEQRRRKES